MDCSVDYAGRMDTHLPRARRLIMLKADGSLLVHADDGSYRPLNWISTPCHHEVIGPDHRRWPDMIAHEEENRIVSGGGGKAMLPELLPQGSGGPGISPQEFWLLRNVKTADTLLLAVFQIVYDSRHDLGREPGLRKYGPESRLQELLALQIKRLGAGYQLLQREYPTSIGPVDILARDAEGRAVAVEVKRNGELSGVEQLTRYLEQLNQTPLAPVRGVLAALRISPQAQVLAEQRNIGCLTLDLQEMLESRSEYDLRLF